jgi:UDP-N-acetyl-D-mannosaminuronic acid transferase (WecB/TagA/CpsF family)
MHDSNSYVLGCRLDPFTMAVALDKVEGWIEQAEPGASAHIITLNAEIAYQAHFDEPLRDLINRAWLVTPDGIGIVWGARKLGIEVPERVTGIDLMERICQRAAARGWKVFFLGAAPLFCEYSSACSASLVELVKYIQRGKHLRTVSKVFYISGCRDNSEPVFADSFFPARPCLGHRIDIDPPHAHSRS